jgi:hypothetical protein
MKIFGPKRDEVTGELGKLHNEELNDLYCSPTVNRVIKLRRITWVEHIVCMWEGRRTYRALVVRSEGKSPPGSPRHG